jgi:hypothetical protein
MKCNQPLFIHVDGRGSCSRPRCLDQGSVFEAVRRHRYVVNCQTILGARCAVCHGPDAGDGRAASRPRSGERPKALCSGVATVHADLSFECSAPHCPAVPSRNLWLAGHDDIRSCGDIVGGCPLCPPESGVV